jgi:ATP-dependent DNA ligase
MEAETAAELPRGREWQYEPKWDGFRCIAFRDGDKVRLQSKAGKPLERYFPELVAALLSLPAKRFVVDGEIVVEHEGHLAFDHLLMRIHPAASRIARLALEEPADLKLFDILVDDRGALRADEPLADRRDRLERFATKYLEPGMSLALSRATKSLATAKRWLAGAGIDTDGVVAKRIDLPYQSGNRDGMVKVKRIRSADCVVGGFRYATKGKEIGSLLLGLYDEEKKLNHVGFCSGLDASLRKGLAARLEALVKPPGFTGRAPGRPSRWNGERSTGYEPLASKLVVEVSYDHVTDGRFRHGTRFLRWRPDKAPSQCTMEQIEQD